MNEIVKELNYRRLIYKQNQHLVYSCDIAIAEIERLLRGEFTEEEFQNLCHNFSEDDESRFKEGCKAYQDKLFSCKKNQE